MSFLHALTYFSALIFIIFCMARLIRLASAPTHLRWELYPVPHEKGKSSYGGSFMEEPNWWEKKIEKDRFGELKVMIPEILFLKGVWEANPKLWFGSFAFHFGLYMLIGNMVLAIVGAIMSLSGVEVAAGAVGIGGYMHLAMSVLITAGCALGFVGALRLLFLRIVDNGLRNFSSGAHYFNIILIGAFFLTGLLWQVGDANAANAVLGYYKGLISLSAFPAFSGFGAAHIYIGLFFVMYLPFTHMTHFFTKYFTYHSVRWEDMPNLPGNKKSKEVAELLNQPVSWSAPHIGADGTKTWLTIATTNPWEKKDDSK